MTVRRGTYFAATKCSGGPDITTQLFQAYFTTRFSGTRNGGIYNCRNIAGSDTLSVHGTGRAGDLMTGESSPTMATKFLAEQMRLFSKEAGLQGIIFNRRQWFCHKGDEWREYHGSNPHTDHIHYERVPEFPLTQFHIKRIFQGEAVTGNVLRAGRVVKQGVTGDATKYIQRRLGAHGWMLMVDGIAGPKTHAAIRQFQAFAGIAVDGIAGPVTQGRMQ